MRIYFTSIANSLSWHNVYKIIIIKNVNSYFLQKYFNMNKSFTVVIVSHYCWNVNNNTQFYFLSLYYVTIFTCFSILRTISLQFIRIYCRQTFAMPVAPSGNLRGDNSSGQKCSHFTVSERKNTLYFETINLNLKCNLKKYFLNHLIIKLNKTWFVLTYFMLTFYFYINSITFYSVRTN
jgi:hypothetical protein